MLWLTRKISFIVAPHGSSKSWTRAVPIPVILAISAALLLGILFLFVLTIRVVDLASQVRQFSGLKEENENLRTQLTGMRDLEREVIRLQEFEIRFRRWAGLGLPGRAVMTRTAPGRRNFDWEEEDLQEIPTILPAAGVLSREFSLGQEGHEGIDVAGETGSPILASAAGLVRFAGWDEIYGNVVVLDHEGGFSTLYGHNDTLLVRTGQEVRRQQSIARLGNSGRSSAPHVHFEVRLNEHPLDPLKLVPRDQLKS